MTRVFLADSQTDERRALRGLLRDLNMEIVGETSDWPATLAKVPRTRLDMLLVEWSLLPAREGAKALADLRSNCPGAIVVVLISHLDARQQAELSTGADVFISKSETPDRVAEHLRTAAESARAKPLQAGQAARSIP